VVTVAAVPVVMVVLAMASLLAEAVLALALVALAREVAVAAHAPFRGEQGRCRLRRRGRLLTYHGLRHLCPMRVSSISRSNFYVQVLF
jgi:hypothetical protein